MFKKLLFFQSIIVLGGFCINPMGGLFAGTALHSEVSNNSNDNFNNSSNEEQKKNVTFQTDMSNISNGEGKNTIRTVIFSYILNNFFSQNPIKYSLNDLNALSGEISDVRQDLYNSFFKTYVMEMPGIVKNQTPEGLYLKYKDMLQLNQTYDQFLGRMHSSMYKLYSLALRIGALLLQLDSEVHPMNLTGELNLESLNDQLSEAPESKKIFSARFKELMDLAPIYDLGREKVSYNDFIKFLENMDLFLENSRQIFTGFTMFDNYLDKKHVREHKTKRNKLPILKAGLGNEKPW